jgi:hypothetical protein
MELDGFIYYKSDKPNKKLMVDINGKRIYFGDTRYEHYFDRTGLLNKNYNHLDPKRRLAYLARSTKIKDSMGNFSVNNPESANFHSARVIW